MKSMHQIDHRDLISAYDLGHIEQHSPGLIHWHPNGVHLLRKLEKWILSIHEAHNYSEVRSPMILSRELWKKSGHWGKYKDLMFSCDLPDEQSYAVKPMSCPGQISIYANQRRSYRELPMKLFEFGHVHRREPSGALSGWMRLRGFVQDDSHVFCDKADIQSVISDFASMVEQVYRCFGFEKWSWKLSLRPDIRSGSDDVWDEAENALRQACSQLGIEVQEAPGDGAFYGPKLEASLIDRLGRSWQCGVAQVDFVLPKQFDLSFQNKEGEKARPVLIHHAILGSLERWLSIVMENQGSLPDWLSPHVVALLPIGKDQSSHVHKLAAQLKEENVPVVVLEDGPLSGRVRLALSKHYSHLAVIGNKEIENGMINVRMDDGKSILVKEPEWIDSLKKACKPPLASL